MSDAHNNRRLPTTEEVEDLLGRSLDDDGAGEQVRSLNEGHELERHGWSDEVRPAETYVEEESGRADKDRAKVRTN